MATETKNQSDSGFSAEEIAAMKARAAELRAEKGGAKKADEAERCLEAIAAMSQPDRRLAERIHALTDRGVDAFIVNFGAYSHTSIALHDALKASGLPAVEVHISDIKQREKFRHRSMTARACVAMISGRGFPGYVAALRRLAKS